MCACGNYTVVPSYRLRHGGVTSCGCHQHDRNFCSKKAKNNPRLYRVYQSIRTRCYNPNNQNYYLYGGRGIKLCSEWLAFYNFCDWALANGYNENAEFGKCTIDRIDPDKDYSPSNCRWVSMREQNNNRRNNRKITYNGITRTAAEWARETGIKSGLICQRIDNGWAVEEALSIPVLGRCEHYYRKTIRERT